MKTQLARRLIGGVSIVASIAAAPTGWAQSTAAVPAAPATEKPRAVSPAAAPTAPAGATTNAGDAPSSPKPLVADEVVNADRPEPSVQHSVIEDQGSKIDELRVRGQTRYIVVTPKVGTTKSYQILVNTDGRIPFEGTGGVAGASGKRVWNVFDF